jgi:transcriptional regulator with XRE-family HTH domain
MVVFAARQVTDGSCGATFEAIMRDDPWKAHADALGAFIRTQRALADMSLRDMASMTKVSNAYLSQIERGLHQPSLRVLRAIADALHVPVDQLLTEAGLLPEEDDAQHPAADGGAGSTVAAILADPLLNDEQRQALISVYRSFVGGNEPQ